jgi:hypothetical protein
MGFKKGDIIHNNSTGEFEVQWVKLLSDIKPNRERHGDECFFRSEYPYKAKVIHIKGQFAGEIVYDYYISRDSVLIKDSGEFFNRIIKPFEFA